MSRENHPELNEHEEVDIEQEEYSYESSPQDPPNTANLGHKMVTKPVSQGVNPQFQQFGYDPWAFTLHPTYPYMSVGSSSPSMYPNIQTSLYECLNMCEHTISVILCKPDVQL